MRGMLPLDPPSPHHLHSFAPRRILTKAYMRPYKCIYTFHSSEWTAMAAETPIRPEFCNCLALRQAARHVSQFYDQLLAPSGLRTTQFSILGKLRHLGPLTINALAKELVMDRTTLGRNILPLEREGLI